MAYAIRAQGGLDIKFWADGFRARFKARLAEVAKAKGWPGNGQVPFAALVTERTGFPLKQPRVSDLLKGSRKPSLREVEALAVGLDVTPGWLAFRETAKDADQPLAQPLPRRVRQKVGDPDLAKVVTRKEG